MEKNQEKIEIYKPRDFAERLAVTFKFIRKNFGVIMKNTAWFIVPIALIQSWFMKDVMGVFMNASLLQNKLGTDYVNLLISYGATVILMLIVTVILYSLTASMIKAYDRGMLNKNTTIGDLKDFGSFVAKTFLIMLCAMIAAGGSAFLAGAVLILISPFLVFLLVVGVIVVLPSLSLIYYPAYYEGLSVWESIVKGFRLGFKHWGTTFLMVIVLSIVFGVIQYVLVIPLYIWLFVKMLLLSDTSHWYEPLIAYLTTLVSCLGSYIIIPPMVIGMSFQYFGIREKEEQVSVLSQLDDFENL